MARFHDLNDSITPGSKLSFPDADAQNAMLEAGRWVRSHKEQLNRLVAPKGFGPSLSLWGKNDTGQLLSLYSIVKLDNVLFDKTANSDEFLFRPSISLKMPDIDEPSGIVAAPAESGLITEVRTIGVSPVQVDVVSAGHEFARATTNDPAKLKSSTAGEYEILWKEAGTGVKWALVRFPSSGGADPVKWAAMDGKWWHGTNTDYCFAHPVNDPAGTGEDILTNLFIWLPKQGITPYSPPNGLLPNLRTQQVIPYLKASDGTLVIAQDYIDHFKGAVQMMVRDHVPEGWAKMDGTANSVANGGSAIVWDLNRYPRETKTAAELGTKGKTDGTIPNHSHQICSTTTGKVASDPNSAIEAVRFNAGWQQCTVGAIQLPMTSCAGPCNAVGPVDPIIVEPPWLKGYMLERIDNSGNPDLTEAPHSGHP